LGGKTTSHNTNDASVHRNFGVENLDIESLLAPFQHFGVNLGLERIQNLLTALDSPHHRFPIVHVGGTNGKGSVCAYLSSVLSTAGYKVGRYTSPHLVEWNERICINGQPIATDRAIEVIQKTIAAIPTDKPIPTQFEVVTAAAWLYFAEKGVDIAVIEVGLGGRLDATNVCDRPLATAITSISREHWQQLGDTVAKIATEKAGILKPGCPTIIGTLPPGAAAVIEQRAADLQCPTIWVQPAQILPDVPANPNPWVEASGIKYPLALLGEMQLTNSAIAIETLKVLRQAGWHISDEAIIQGMATTQWTGRIQWITWKGRKLLIDGAHNPAAAIALRQYIDTLDKPISWTMGMLSTKEHAPIFQALLRSGDRLDLVPVPDHSSAEVEDLATLAKSICPDLAAINTHTDLRSGLNNAIAHTTTHQAVLCGSLYLLGYFLKQAETDR
jgi:dihydrofolate synthase/folylpolyglutamate synthase